MSNAARISVLVYRACTASGTFGDVQRRVQVVDPLRKDIEKLEQLVPDLRMFPELREALGERG